MSLWTFLGSFFNALIATRGRILKYYVVIRRSRIFDVEYYVGQIPAAERAWVVKVAILHYLVVGEKTGLKPNPLFLKDFYRVQFNAPVKDESYLADYILRGAFLGFRPNPFFAGLYYIEKYHDVLESGQHPLAHYYWSGWKEGRDPHPHFITKDYAKRNHLDLKGTVNPLTHFLEKECSVPSELWGLRPGKPTTVAKESLVFPEATLSVDLIVPVYRRPDLVENLFASLLASPDWQRVSRCVVVDDCGDSFTTKYLQALSLRIDKIKLIKNDSNLGFLRSCNKAYQETSADVVILVNSDVQVPHQWLDRLVAPLALDPKVALSTPLATSGANLSVALRPGQSWVDADHLVSLDKPMYPDACTAIGYLMAIRRKAIATPTLFDDVFQHGYGEDTDLHYRLVSAGWRSVICDNMVILHKGSASYLLDDQKSKIYDQNRKIFFERWGKLHQSAHDRFVADNALGRILTPFAHTKRELAAEDVDVLFVSPTNKRSIGGVKIIFELATYLCDRGIKAKVICTDQTELISDHLHDALMPIFREDTLFRMVKSAKIVIGTGIGVADFTRKVSSHYRAKTWWLVQGPECYFGSGEHYTRFIQELLTVDHVVAVSEYLTGLVIDFGIKTVTTIPLGPDDLVFYPRDVERQPNSIAIQLIDTPDKGARFAISFAQEAKQRGMAVHFFGSGRVSHAIPSGLGTHHGHLGADGLAKLFSQCQFYLDLSLMEGLGLLPLEAAMCGCLPVMTKKGAPDLIFGDDCGVIWLESHLDYKAGIKAILERTESVLKAPRGNTARAAYDSFFAQVEKVVKT